jgi:ankyrin repeat protein
LIGIHLGRNQKLRVGALEEALKQCYDQIGSGSLSDHRNSSEPDSENGDNEKIQYLDSPPDTQETDFSISFEPQMDSIIDPVNVKKTDFTLPTFPISMGRPALHRAASTGNESMICLLLDKGANINVQDSLGQTALHVAIESGSESAVKALLEKNIDANVKDSEGRTGLFQAVQNDNAVLAKLLLEAFVDVNATDVYGNAALHLAVEKGLEQITLLLLAYGADINC